MIGPRLVPRAQAPADQGGAASRGSTRGTSAARRGLKRIVLAGLLLELLLILSFIPAPLVPLTADSGMDELLPWLEILGRPIHEKLALLEPWIGLTRLAIILQMACFLALFLPYAGALRSLRDRSDLAAGRAVLLFGLLFAMTGLCARRLFSTDLFSYVLNGRIMAVYGGNPYVDTPAQFSEDPYLPLVVWREAPNHYGPLWTFVSAAVTSLGGEQLGLTLFLFRLVSAVATVCTTLLVWRFLRRVRPNHAALGTAVWAWNPLVILEGAGSGHNDPVLALLLVLAVVALTGRRAVLGMLALTGALLVKYSVAVLAPLYLIVLLRRTGPRALCLGLAAAGVLVIGSFLPFRSGDSLPAGVYVSSPARYLNSPTALLYNEARRWLGEDSRLDVEQVEFRPWWGVVRTPTELLFERGRVPLSRIEAGAVVLATDRPDRGWQLVYDPAGRTTGYVALATLRKIGRPPDLATDPELDAHERGPIGSEVVNWLNLAIRGGGWLAVFLAMAGLMRAARTPDGLLRGWLLLLTLVYWLAATWFFPWYLIWGLTVAALRPRGPLVWAMVAWSAAVLLYYGAAPFEWDDRLGWLYRWRAVPMFLPPLLVFAGYWLARRRRPVAASSAPGLPSP